MYESFSVRDFRGFTELKIEDLKRVNLITGKNNVGKTTLLEAIFFDANSPNIGVANLINKTRGIVSSRVPKNDINETLLDSFFHNYDSSKTIEFSSERRVGRKRIKDNIKLRFFDDISQIEDPLVISRFAESFASNWSYNEKTRIVNKFVSSDMLKEERIAVLEFLDGRANETKFYFLPIPPRRNSMFSSSPSGRMIVYYQTSRGTVSLEDIAELFAKVQFENLDKEFTEVLRVLEPRLKDVRQIFWGGNPYLFGNLSGLNNPLPLQLMGEGTNRLASILLYIMNAKDGVVLIDEIENGFHYSVLPHIWEIIQKAAVRFNVQVFASTHSYECVTAALSIFERKKYDDFRLFRLERNQYQENISIESYSVEELGAATDLHLEVR